MIGCRSYTGVRTQVLNPRSGGFIVRVLDSFVVRGRGTLVTGPRFSEVNGTVRIGDSVWFTREDGHAVITTVAGIEMFMGPPQDDPMVGILLAEGLGIIPSGTIVYLSLHN